VPANAPGEVVAETTDPSETLAAILPWESVDRFWISLWRVLKLFCRVVNSDCCPWKVLTEFCIACSGREAIDTARCRTCWKELEKVLDPLNVIVLAVLAAEVTLEAIIESLLQKRGRTTKGPAPANLS
jgi:hypothetical protein